MKLFFQGAVMDPHQPVLHAPVVQTTPRIHMHASLQWHAANIFEPYAKVPLQDAATAELKTLNTDAVITQAVGHKTEDETGGFLRKTLKTDSIATKMVAPKTEASKATTKSRPALCEPLAKPALDNSEVALTKYCAALFPTMGHHAERNLGCIFRTDATSAVLDGQHEKVSQEQRVRSTRDTALIARKRWLRRRRQRNNDERGLALRGTEGGKLKLPLLVTQSPSGATITGRITFGMAAPSSAAKEQSNLIDFVRAENNLAQRTKRRTSIDENIAISPTAQLSQDTLSKHVGKLGMLSNLGDEFFMQRLKEAYCQKPYGGVKCEQTLQDRVRILRGRHKLRREKRLTNGNNGPCGAAEEEKQRVCGTYQDDYRKRVRSVFHGVCNEDSEELDGAEDVVHTLMPHAVRRALMQLKLWPTTADEKHAYDEAVKRVFYSSHNAAGDVRNTRKRVEDDGHCTWKIAFEQFFALITTLKKDIGACRRVRAKELFEDFREEGAEFLTEDAIFHVADMYILQPCQSLYLKSDEALCKVRACIRELMASYQDEVDCGAFYTLYGDLETSINMLKFVKSEDLSKMLHLVPRVAREHREDLCDLKCMFEQYDEDHSQLLSKGEVLLLCADLGVTCATRQERLQVEHVFRKSDVDGSGELDFVEFLSFLTHVREQIAETNCAHYNALFCVFDKDDSGSLSYREAAMCLGHLGLYPRTKDEQVEFTLALEELCDEETNTLREEDFPTFVQNIREIIIRNERKTYMTHGKELGFTAAEARAMRVAFDRLFAPAQQIGVGELEQLLAFLHKKVESAELRRLFQENDKNDDHEIDFLEFLTLMKTLTTEGHEDVFPAISQTSPRETVLRPTLV